MRHTGYHQSFCWYAAARWTNLCLAEQAKAAKSGAIIKIILNVQTVAATAAVAANYPQIITRCHYLLWTSRMLVGERTSRTSQPTMWSETRDSQFDQFNPRLAQTHAGLWPQIAISAQFRFNSQATFHFLDKFDIRLSDLNGIAARACCPGHKQKCNYVKTDETETEKWKKIRNRRKRDWEVQTKKNRNRWDRVWKAKTKENRNRMRNIKDKPT